MSDIRIESAHLRSAGVKHQGAADYLRGVPDTHPQIQSFLSSLGPIFGDFKAAGGQVLDARKRCYEQQADDHEHVTRGLHQVASTWDEHERGAGQQFGGLVGGGGPAAPAPSGGGASSAAPAPSGGAGGGGPAVQSVSLSGIGPSEELITNPNPVLQADLPGASGGEGMPRIPDSVINPKPGRSL